MNGLTLWLGAVPVAFVLFAIFKGKDPRADRQMFFFERPDGTKFGRWL